MITDLEKVYRALPDKARRKVQVMFVTIDPERDQPELMKKYISYFDPDNPIAARSAAGYNQFLQLISKLPERFGVRVHAFVLLANHYHLQSETPRSALSWMPLLGQDPARTWRSWPEACNIRPSQWQFAGSLSSWKPIRPRRT
ncbi:MAG: SCO family protein [Verrucomicrobia bacterium]|nr:SCO family protein [Verrucomicrobiota bacterium]